MDTDTTCGLTTPQPSVNGFLRLAYTCALDAGPQKARELEWGDKVQGCCVF